LVYVSSREGSASVASNDISSQFPSIPVSLHNNKLSNLLAFTGISDPLPARLLAQLEHLPAPKCFAVSSSNISAFILDNPGPDGVPSVSRCPFAWPAMKNSVVCIPEAANRSIKVGLTSVHDIPFMPCEALAWIRSVTAIGSLTGEGPASQSYRIEFMTRHIQCNPGPHDPVCIIVPRDNKIKFVPHVNT